MNEEDNFDSVCNNKLVMKKGEEKPPSVYDQWQGNEVNSIQTSNQETTMEHFFDLLENKDIQFFGEEYIQEDRDQRIDSVWNYKVVPRMDQLNLNIDSMGNTEHLLMGKMPDNSNMDQRINPVWNYKRVTRMVQQEDKPTSLYDLGQENEVKSSSDERSINKTEALSEYLFQILLQGLSVLSAMGSLQTLCILQGNLNFLTKNSFPTRSYMRTDSMRNEDPQFNQTQTIAPQRGDVKKMPNEDNQKYEMDPSYKVAFLL